MMQTYRCQTSASVILCWVSWVENVLLIYYASSDLFVCLHWKNPRFMAFLDSNLHTWLAIVTANELELAFPPRNLSKKIRPDPSTFYLVIVVTDKQTDRQTYAGDSIMPCESFRGDNNKHKTQSQNDVQSIRTENYFTWQSYINVPSVLWCCWLGGRKGIWPVKNWVVRCWCGYLSGARCRLAYGPADSTATHCLLLP